MKLSPTARLKLLLDIFHENGIYIGGWMEFMDLTQAWRHTGLRLADMEAVIDLAAECEMVELDQHHGLASVRLLTDSIPEHFERRRGIRKASSLAKDLAALAQIRLRKKIPKEPKVVSVSRRKATPHKER